MLKDLTNIIRNSVIVVAKIGLLQYNIDSFLIFYRLKHVSAKVSLAFKNCNRIAAFVHVCMSEFLELTGTSLKLNCINT